MQLKKEQNNHTKCWEIFSTNLEILYFLEDLLSPCLETADRSFKKDT